MRGCPMADPTTIILDTWEGGVEVVTVDNYPDGIEIGWCLEEDDRPPTVFSFAVTFAQARELAEGILARMPVAADVKEEV